MRSLGITGCLAFALELDLQLEPPTSNPIPPTESVLTSQQQPNPPNPANLQFLTPASSQLFSFRFPAELIPNPIPLPSGTTPPPNPLNKPNPLTPPPKSPNLSPKAIITNGFPAELNPYPLITSPFSQFPLPLILDQKKNAISWPCTRTDWPDYGFIVSNSTSYGFIVNSRKHLAILYHLSRYHK